MGETWFVNGVPRNIVLASIICTEWQGFEAPAKNTWAETPDELAGAALLIAVHESEHFRYADTNEAVTECRALRDFPSVAAWVTHLQPKAFQAKLQAWLWKGAVDSDAQMPQQYHGGSC